MPRQEPVQHQGDKLLKPFLHALFQGIGIEGFRNRLHQLPVQRVFPIQLMIIVVQDVFPDIRLVAMQQKPLAGLANNRQAVGRQLLPQLLQITNQGSTAHIHFISQLVRQNRLLGANQLAECVIHAISCRIEKCVCFD